MDRRLCTTCLRRNAHALYRQQCATCYREQLDDQAIAAQYGEIVEQIETGTHKTYVIEDADELFRLIETKQQKERAGSLNGIVIEAGITNFEEAIALCELAFQDPHTFKEEWAQVKTSHSFAALAQFLKSHDITHRLF